MLFHAHFNQRRQIRTKLAGTTLFVVMSMVQTAMGVHMNSKAARTQTYTPISKMSFEPDGRFPGGIPSVSRPILYHHDTENIKLRTRHWPSGQPVKSTVPEGPLISTLMIDRPGNANSLSLKTVEDLLFAVESLDRDRVKALILTGVGDIYSAGGHLPEAAKMTQADANVIATTANNVGLAIENGPFFTIFVANGGGRGAGLQSTASADLRIVRKNHVFAQTEFKIGLPVGWGGRSRIPLLLRDDAVEAWSSGEPFSGAQGKEWGLFDHALDADADMNHFVDDIIAGLFKEGLGQPGGAQYLKSRYHRNKVPFESLVDERNSFARTFAPEDAAGNSDGRRKLQAVIEALERRKAAK